MSLYYKKIIEKYGFPRENRRKQIVDVRRAINCMKYEEVVMPPPSGITMPRWRAMIKQMYLNGEPA